MNKYDIILAGLLHDIGKFFEKANSKGESISGIEVSTLHHAITSANFIKHFQDKLSQVGFDIEAVKEMVQRHHEYNKDNPASVEGAPIKYRPYCYIIDKADNLSSSERLNTKAADGSYQLRQLTDVFSVVAGKRYSQESGVFTDVYNKINEGNKLNSESTNIKLVQQFITDFSSIESTDKTEFIGKVNALLKKYTWCFPSDTREYIRDISLYSHLQTTAAIAGVLYDDLTLNPEYKHGLTQDKQGIGWKFTEVSIKELRTQQIEIAKIHLANSMDILTSADIADIPRLKSYLIKCRKELIDQIYSNIGLTPVNIICTDDYSITLITRVRTSERIVNLIKEFNKKLPQFVGKQVIYFEIAYSKLSLDELSSNDTGEILSRLDKVINTQWKNTKYNIEYFGLSSLMVSDNGKWENIGISNIATPPEVSSYAVLKKKQLEVIEKLNSNVLALVKIRIDNYDEIMSRILSMTFNDTHGLLHNNLGDKKIGTVCRLSALMDQISRLIALEFADCMYLYKGTDGIILITSLQNAFRLGQSHRRIIAKQSINVIKTSLFIETIYRKDVELASREIDKQSKIGTEIDTIYYNGLKLSTEQFNKIPGLMDTISESGRLKEGKGNLYKIIEFIGMYEEYRRTGDTHYLLCIPRFEYNAKRNFNDNSITNTFRSLITSEFDKISKSKNSVNNDNDLLLIKQIIYDIIQILKVS